MEEINKKFPTSLEEKINKFLSSQAFGVIGASKNRDKYGNKIVRCYLQHKKLVYPVNPKEQKIEEIPCIANVKELPATVNSISIVMPPTITEEIIVSSINKGIANIWLQPGSYDANVINNINKIINIDNDNQTNLIYGGVCILATLGYIDQDQ